MKNIMRVVCLAILSSGVVACGKIPSELRGKYIDSTHGVEVELKSKGGALTLEGESSREFAAKSLEVEALAKGQPGIYLRSIGEKSSGALEIFWIEPDPSSIQEQYGFVTLKAQVLYTRFNLGGTLGIQRGLDGISARFCKEGQVLVDRVSQSFNGGCPSDSVLLNLRRVPET